MTDKSTPRKPSGTPATPQVRSGGTSADVTPQKHQSTPAALRVHVMTIDFVMEPPEESLGDPTMGGFGQTPPGIPAPTAAALHHRRSAGQVPVVRCFGRRAGGEGEAVVVHLHGALPYFYVPWPADWNVKEAPELLAQFAVALEAQKCAGGGRRTLVHACWLVSGCAYYGYRTDDQLWIQIVLYDPTAVPRLAAVLGCSAEVMDRTFAPHEAHLSFEMQVSCDLGLLGADPLALEACTPRQRVEHRDGQIRVDARAWLDVMNRRGLPCWGLRPDSLGAVSSDSHLVSTLRGLWEADASQDTPMRTPASTVVVPEAEAPPLPAPRGYAVGGRMEDAFRRVFGRVCAASAEELPTQRMGASSELPRAGCHSIPDLDGWNWRNSFRELCGDLCVDDVADAPAAGGAHDIVATQMMLEQLRDDTLGYQWGDDEGEEEEEEDEEVTEEEEELMPPDDPAPAPARAARLPAPAEPPAECVSPLFKRFRFGDCPTPPRRSQEPGSPPKSLRGPQPLQLSSRAKEAVSCTRQSVRSSTQGTRTDGTAASLQWQLSGTAGTTAPSWQWIPPAPTPPTVPACLPQHAPPPPPTPPAQIPSQPPAPTPPPQKPSHMPPPPPPTPPAQTPNMPPPPPPAAPQPPPTPPLPHQAAAASELPTFRPAPRRRLLPEEPYNPVRGPLRSEVTQHSPAAEEDGELGSAVLPTGAVPLLTGVSGQTGRTQARVGAMSRADAAAAATLPPIQIAGVELLTECSVHRRCSDPSENELLAVCIVIHAATAMMDETTDQLLILTSLPALPSPPPALSPAKVSVRDCGSEGGLIDAVLTELRSADPDVLVGWDVQRHSLGYLFRRAEALGLDCSAELAREEASAREARATDAADMMHGAMKSSGGVRVTGRVILNLWRSMRSEVKLRSYTFAAVCQSVLSESAVPVHTQHALSRWARSSDPTLRAHALQHLLRTGQRAMRLVNFLDVVNRTAELARVFGIQFFEVLSRGSQFRVESMMARLAKPLGYLLLSPSRRHVEDQNRQEGVPLVLEPLSGYYRSPVIVLDFRSLYPSMVIAYNLCFSTCLGKVTRGEGRKKVGVLDGYSVPKRFLARCGAENDVTIAHNSCMFVHPAVRRGVLPRMLSEILRTRFKVQDSLKAARQAGDHVRARILDARQLGLKLIANVTYGYTSATFTGRMPCSDIADAIVLCAKETLERTICMVESTEEWGAQVVYGDTDSLFVCVPGATLERAFEVGRAIVQKVAEDNPEPVRLKLEKVYKPCVLVTKKRYAGYAYESPLSKPSFDAKGLECIRRDQSNAVQSIQHRALRILFDTDDTERVREYVQRQLGKIRRHDMNPCDLILRHEVKLGSYKDPTMVPPAAAIAQKMMRQDSLDEPLYNERVPYLVVAGGIKDRLVDLSVHASEMLTDPRPLNAEYYCRKQVCPPLDRVLRLAGAEVFEWLEVVPRGRTARLDAGRESLTTYLSIRPTRCRGCGTHLSNSEPLCQACRADSTAAAKSASRRTAAALKELEELAAGCGVCTGCGDPAVTADCLSLDCEVPWRRSRAMEVHRISAEDEEFLRCHHPAT